jgi:hypothetical protein
MQASIFPQHTPNWHRLVIWIGVVSIISVICQLLLLSHVGPLVSQAVFLIMPVVLATLRRERWTIPVAPFVFWDYAWLFLWLNHPVVTIEVLFGTVVSFSIASLIGAALGLQLGRLLTRFNFVSPSPR